MVWLRDALTDREFYPGRGGSQAPAALVEGLVLATAGVSSRSDDVKVVASVQVRRDRLGWDSRKGSRRSAPLAGIDTSGVGASGIGQE